MPKPVALWQSIFLVYDNTVWLATFVVYVLVGLVILTFGIFIKTERNYYKRLNEIFLILLSLLVYNAFGVAPTSIKIRMVIFAWALFCINWYAAYTSTLIRMLTNPINNEHV